MNILVTGGNGFLGKTLVPAMREAGHNIIELSTEKTLCGNRIYDLVSYKDTCNWIYSVLCDDDKIDAVVHLAARCGGIGANMEAPADFFYDNMAMGTNLINNVVDAFIKNKHNPKIKFVFLGTTCSYPRDAQLPFREDDLFAGVPEETNAPYAIAKRALMVYGNACSLQHGLNFITLIPTNLYGEHDSFDPAKSHVIPALIRKFYEAAKRGDDHVILWGDGSATRDVLYVKDCAAGIIKALETYNEPYPINLGSGDEHSIFDLANEVMFHMDEIGLDVPTKIIYDTSKPNGQPRRCLSVDRAARWLGWQATTPLCDGIKNTIKYFLKEVAPTL